MKLKISNQQKNGIDRRIKLLHELETACDEILGDLDTVDKMTVLNLLSEQQMNLEESTIHPLEIRYLEGLYDALGCALDRIKHPRNLNY